MTKFIKPLVLILLLASGRQLSIAQHFDVSATEGCSPLTVEFTNNNPSNGYTAVPMQTTGFSYHWDFGNGQTSSVENPDSVVYDDPGSYEVNYHTTIDTIGFRLHKIHISEIACDDPNIWPLTNDPDIYIQLVDGGGNVILDTYDTADDNSTDPDDVNVVFTFSEIQLNNPPYFLRVLDKDSGDSDDNCIDGEENLNAGTLIPLPDNDSTTFGETTNTITNDGLEFTAYFNKIVFNFDGSETITVNPPPAPPVVDQTEISICYGSPAPTLSAEGSNIKWYSDAELTNLVSDTDTYDFSPDSTGLYHFYVTQTSETTGCTSNPVTVSVDVHEMTPPELSEDSLIYCYGQVLPEIVASGEVINWYSDESLSQLIHTGDTLSIDTISPGEYDFYVTQNDSLGTCESNAASLHVSYVNTIDAEVSVTDVSCYGSNDGSASIDVTGGNEPFTITWSDGTNGTELTGLSAGEYTAAIVDQNFCLKNVMAEINSPDSISIEAQVSHVSCSENDGEISLMVSGGTTPYSYEWNDGKTEANRSNISKGTYIITVTDALSCSSYKEIIVDKECLEPASVLTPNGDGKNDTWKLKYLELYENVEVMIFDRSGNKVYENKNYDNSWDGTSNGKALPMASYYYIINLNDNSDPEKGFVDIIR